LVSLSGRLQTVSKNGG